MRERHKQEQHDGSRERGGGKVLEEADPHLPCLVKAKKRHGNGRERGHDVNLPRAGVSNHEGNHIGNDARDGAQDGHDECREASAERDLTEVKVLRADALAEEAAFLTHRANHRDDVVHDHLVHGLHDIERVNDEPVKQNIRHCEEDNILDGRKRSCRIHPLADFDELHQHEQGKDRLCKRDHGGLMDRDRNRVDRLPQKARERSCQNPVVPDGRYKAVVHVEEAACAIQKPSLDGFLHGSLEVPWRSRIGWLRQEQHERGGSEHACYHSSAKARPATHMPAIGLIRVSAQNISFLPARRGLDAELVSAVVLVICHGDDRRCRARCCRRAIRIVTAQGEGGHK